LCCKRRAMGLYLHPSTIDRRFRSDAAMKSARYRTEISGFVTS
jgi:hypothetical protein